MASHITIVNVGLQWLNDKFLNGCWLISQGQIVFKRCIASPELLTRIHNNFLLQTSKTKHVCSYMSSAKSKWTKGQPYRQLQKTYNLVVYFSRVSFHNLGQKKSRPWPWVVEFWQNLKSKLIWNLQWIWISKSIYLVI